MVAGDGGVMGDVMVKLVELQVVLTRVEAALRRPDARCQAHYRDALDGVIEFVRAAEDRLTDACALAEGLLAEMGGEN